MLNLWSSFCIYQSIFSTSNGCVSQSVGKFLSKIISESSVVILIISSYWLLLYSKLHSWICEATISHVTDPHWGQQDKCKPPWVERKNVDGESRWAATICHFRRGTYIITHCATKSFCAQFLSTFSQQSVLIKAWLFLWTPHRNF